MTQKTKFENELDRAMKEAKLRLHMITEYEARLKLLMVEAREIRQQLDKLRSEDYK